MSGLTQTSVTTKTEDLLTRAEEETLASSVISGTGSNEAVRILVERNYGLIHNVIRKRFSWMGPDEAADAFSDGKLGMVKAALHFKPEMARFSTYSVPWVFKEIINGARLRGLGALHLGNFNDILRIRRVMRENTLTEQDVDELIDKSGLPKSRVLNAISTMGMVITSLDIPGGAIDTEDTREIRPDLSAEMNDMLAIVMEVIEELHIPDSEVALLCSNPGDGTTETLASERRVTQSAIRMLKGKLIWSIRKRIFKKIGSEEYRRVFSTEVPDPTWR